MPFASGSQYSLKPLWHDQCSNGVQVPKTPIFQVFELNFWSLGCQCLVHQQCIISRCTNHLGREWGEIYQENIEKFTLEWRQMKSWCWSRPGKWKGKWYIWFDGKPLFPIHHFGWIGQFSFPILRQARIDPTTMWEPHFRKKKTRTFDVLSMYSASGEGSYRSYKIFCLNFMRVDVFLTNKDKFGLVHIYETRLVSRVPQLG